MTTTDGLPELPGIDKAEGLKRMMNKAALYEKVLRDFHARFANESAAIRETIASGDFSAAERRAHSAKGLAATIGAGALQSAAHQLEIALGRSERPADSLVDRFEQELQQAIDGIARGFGI